MSPWVEVLLAIAAIAGIASTAIQALGLWIITDLRDRIVRVENWIIENGAKVDDRQQVIPFEKSR